MSDWSYIPVKEDTRKRVDTVYFELRKKDRNATFDDTIKLLLENYEASLEAAEKIGKETKKKGEVVA